MDVDLAEEFTFEELVDAAADTCRGKRLTEDEFENHRALWAGLGVVLAPCAPEKTVDSTSDSDDSSDYDRAMEFLT
jgi:hypothetical protein